MNGIKIYLILPILCLMLLQPLLSQAGQLNPGPFYAPLRAVDMKKRTILLGKKHYMLRIGVSIHDSENKFPRLSAFIGQEIKYKLRKNRRTGNIEVSEIWIQHM